jgi:NADH-quinone oxidoreductase subunit L
MAFYKYFVGAEAEHFWNGALHSAAVHGEAHATPEHGAPAAAEAAAHGEETAHGGEAEHHFPTWVLWAPFIAMTTGLLLAAKQYLNDRPLAPGLLRPGGMVF